MSVFVCPVCKKALCKNENSMLCENGHLYDISRHGYVNLLMSSKSKDKRHGDDKLMIKARRDFLNSGAYSPLLKSVSESAVSFGSPEMKILDVGCGECYYTAGIAKCLREFGIDADINGVDISKDALIWGGKRDRGISLAVASVFDLPTADSSCNMLINLFAPFARSEFYRVLCPGGILIMAFPLENHLMGLKAAIYDTPYLNPSPNLNVLDFELVEYNEIKYTLSLETNEDVLNLFKMTPYYYKTGKSDQEKLNSVNSLSTQVEFGLAVYRKK